MQTSIEWFIEHLLGNGLLRLTKEDHSLYSELRDKAKEMYKQEIENTYWNAYNEGQYSGDKTAEEYYQEKFKKDMFMEIKFTNVGKKQSQKKLIKEIMDLDAKDGLYENVNKMAEEMYGKGKVPDYEEGFIDGFNKAKETLYTEISDEDIKRGIKREYLFSNSEEKRLMIEGAMWYKEQLKKIKSVTNCNQLTTK